MRSPDVELGAHIVWKYSQNWVHVKLFRSTMGKKQQKKNARKSPTVLYSGAMRVLNEWHWEEPLKTGFKGVLFKPAVLMSWVLEIEVIGPPRLTESEIPGSALWLEQANGWLWSLNWELEVLLKVDCNLDSVRKKNKCKVCLFTVYKIELRIGNFKWVVPRFFLLLFF